MSLTSYRDHRLRGREEKSNHSKTFAFHLFHFSLIIVSSLIHHLNHAKPH